MSAVSTRLSQQVTFELNSNKLIDESFQQDETSKITLDSLDINEDTVNQLFEKAVNSNSTEATLADKKMLRASRKAETEKRKQQASQKAKHVYNVVIPQVVEFKGEEILNLCFSQDSIDGKTGDGTLTVEQLADNMACKGWKHGSQITVIQMPDGKLLSADNRRLFAAKKAVEVNKQFALTANLYQHTDRAPKNLMKGVETEFRKGRQIEKTVKIEQLACPALIQPETYGFAMLLRINARNGDLANSHFGYKQAPIIRRD